MQELTIQDIDKIFEQIFSCTDKNTLNLLMASIDSIPREKIYLTKTYMYILDQLQHKPRWIFEHNVKNFAHVIEETYYMINGVKISQNAFNRLVEYMEVQYFLR